MITGGQLRAGRGLIEWNQGKLAEESGLALSTVRRMEGERGVLRSTAENVLRVQKALENAGIIFIDAEEGGDGPGVRLKGPV